uniref:Uncharacterized protein n=1 Tax=Timema tahoe TaxID=61484 RepID=A0A7R9FGD4_9NEOP|nr:unnamed protein product [Timema tahoe]
MLPAMVVKMLAMVVFVFATLWLPYRGMLVYNSFAMLFSRKRFMDLWFLMFAKTCIYINCQCAFCSSAFSLTNKCVIVSRCSVRERDRDVHNREWGIGEFLQSLQ